MSEVEKGKDLTEQGTMQTEAGAEEAAMPVALRKIDKGEVEKLINHSVYASMGIGVLLMPIISLASVTAIQLNMVRKLSKIYGVEFKENLAKKVITTVVAAGVPVLATGPVELLALCIPVVGTAAAFATMPALNGLSTHAIGNMFVTHFEKGGNFINVNVDSLKEDFKTAYQDSREKLGDVISGKKANVENV